MTTPKSSLGDWRVNQFDHLANIEKGSVVNSRTVRNRVLGRLRHELRTRANIDLRRSQDPALFLWNSLVDFQLAREKGGAASDVDDFVSFCLTHHGSHRAQLFQDLFVLFVTREKRNGYFVEFGATDGLMLSNTACLESEYGWNGLLAEPARTWHDALVQNRRCEVDFRCVTDHSGDTVMFNETAAPEFSTIASLSSADRHSRTRETGTRYEVETVGINDLLRDHNVPKNFDYLSIDTEGSEAAILGSFDFDTFHPQIITVEHNFETANREQIASILRDAGFGRVWPELSMWDDWYVSDRANG